MQTGEDQSPSSLGTEKSEPSSESYPFAKPHEAISDSRKGRFSKTKVIAIIIILLIISELLLLANSGALFATLASKTENRAIFSYHTENIHKETLSLPKQDMCVETTPDYNANWNFFYSECGNNELRVNTSLVNVTHVTLPTLNYYFYFEEKSFINVSAKEGRVYYRFSKDVNTASKFNTSTCHDMKEDFQDITQSPLKIFQESGFYHICFDSDSSGDSFTRKRRSSFEMSITEFYKDIPEQKRMNCTYTNEDKQYEKCCRSFTSKEFCVYFFSGDSSFDPVTQLKSVTLRISYSDELKAIPYLSLALAALGLVICVFIAILACCCRCWTNRTKKTVN